jgi:NADPH:quinone reductase-like Zn-dependent oxidoreductase
MATPNRRRRRDPLHSVQAGAVTVASTNASEVQARGKQDSWYEVPPARDPKTIVITGASSGIGFAAAGKLAKAGHNVVMVSRNETKAANACSDVQVRDGGSVM